MNTGHVLALSVFLTTLAFGSGSAYAMGRKLDPASLQGKYNYVPTPDTSLACPEILNVTYDAKTGSLDSEIFHFSKMGQGEQDVPGGGLEGTPDHGGYTVQWKDTKITKNAIVAEKVSQSVSADNLELEQETLGDPIDSPSPADMGLVTTNYIVSMRVQYDAKHGILKKTVSDNDGHDFNETCEYQRAQ